MIIFDRNRIWMIIGVVLTLFIGGYIAYNGQQRLGELNTKLDTANQSQIRLQALIAQRDVLRKQYRTLAEIYIGKQKEVANLEAAFIEDIVHITKKNNVEFVGEVFGVVNGSNPPAPNPYVDRNGQAVDQATVQAAVAAQNQQRAASIIDLGGRDSGDPTVNRPSISPTLFDRVPVSVTLKGHWNNLTSTLQDISRQNVLMSVADPEVRKFDKDNLTLSFVAQILVPAVTIMTDEAHGTLDVNKPKPHIMKSHTMKNRLVKHSKMMNNQNKMKVSPLPSSADNRSGSNTK